MRYRGQRSLLRQQRPQVTGIDFLEEPINRAKQKATERGLSATFFVMDALALKDRSKGIEALLTLPPGQKPDMSFLESPLVEK